MFSSWLSEFNFRFKISNVCKYIETNLPSRPVLAIELYLECERYQNARKLNRKWSDLALITLERVVRLSWKFEVINKNLKNVCFQKMQKKKKKNRFSRCKTRQPLNNFLKIVLIKSSYFKSSCKTLKTSTCTVYLHYQSVIAIYSFSLHLIMFK